MLSILGDIPKSAWEDPTYFDFVPNVQLYDICSITKNNYGGQFAPGVIQYAYSYIREWQGVETNIINTSDLNYISYTNLAGSPEDICSNSFSLRLSGLDTDYKYVRIYSIHRTSLDAIPTIKSVAELEILPPNNTLEGLSDMSFVQFIESFQSTIRNNASLPQQYTAATLTTELVKLTSEYEQLVAFIIHKYQIDITELNNSLFTLKEVAELI